MHSVEVSWFDKLPSPALKPWQNNYGLMMSREHTRPLSPHVGIYRWLMSNTLSILHRVTGFGLSFGLVLLVLWLWGLAYDATLFDMLTSFVGSWLGLLVMFGFTLAFYYHLGNGMRHLYWDMGKGFSLPEMMASGRLVLLFTVSMTIFTWAIVARKGGWL